LKVTFQLAEILVMGAILLLCIHGVAIAPWSYVLLGLGLFAAFTRFALKNQERMTQKENLEKSIEELKKSVPELLQTFIAHITDAQSSENKSKLH
jgi:biopolymer transport protein ExbB/TolQ